MLITSILLAAMAPVSTAQVDTTRAALTKCLRDDLRKSLDAKMADAEYEMALKSNCSEQRSAFRAAVIAFGRSAGDSEKTATEDADFQLDDYNANFTDKFKDYNESGTKPGDD